MIRLPSLQRDFDGYFSKDPAFEQSPPAPDADASEDAKAKYKLELDGYNAKLKAAWETGDWSALIKPGETPTKFVLGQVDRTTWRALDDRVRLPSSNPRHIGMSSLLHLLFRLAIREVAGIDALKVKRLPDSRWDDWVMAQADIVSILDELDSEIVSEIGMQVFWRLQDVGPFGRGSSKG